MEPQPHSADQFGAQRDFWWHRDFLDLMAVRWRLREAASLADIGCGQGHWSRLLYPYLRAPAQLTGVDREERWVAAAKVNFQRAFPQATSDEVRFVQGEATSLPLPDNAFEVVTCQTLLMHLAHPLAALREMLRILRPGGLLICVEPNNLWNYLAFTSLTAAEPVEQLVRRFEFWLRYHRGKVALGQGDHTIGDLLPGHFAALGLSDIRVHQSDRAASLHPPYNTPAQRALIEQGRQWKSSITSPEGREELRRCVLAGGGTEEFLERMVGEVVARFDPEHASVESGQFHAAGGGLLYLVSGRKP